MKNNYFLLKTLNVYSLTLCNTLQVHCTFYFILFFKIEERRLKSPSLHRLVVIIEKYIIIKIRNITPKSKLTAVIINDLHVNKTQ